mgnify:CR=1 FL=1
MYYNQYKFNLTYLILFNIFLVLNNNINLHNFIIIHNFDTHQN